ncbi:MAG: transcriptional regulator [Pedobacter sp.]|nr:MAG: transcriptional regulator [Pedobacter sp.]
MYERKIPFSVSCGLEMSREVLFGKWKMHLLYYISIGVMRPSELQRKIPTASRRVLNIQLNELEQQGIVFKKVYFQLPLKVEYFITPIGVDLLPIINLIGAFGDKNFYHLQQVFINDPKVPIDGSTLGAQAG